LVVPAGRTANARFGIDQSAGDLPDRAVAADGEDRVIFFPRGLVRGLDSMGAAECFGDVHAPASAERFDDAAHKSTHGVTPRGGVVE
jgi:hypothetical protein